MKPKHLLSAILLVAAIIVKADQELINQVDSNSLKQGKWKVINADLTFDGYQKNQVVEEGNYVNNLKDGVWIKYYPNTKIQSKLTFKSGQPKGYAVFYYSTGLVKEEGVWNVDKWVGAYVYYNSNGSVKYDWHYNEDGKREGKQEYFFKSGSKMYSGDWVDGESEAVEKFEDKKPEETKKVEEVESAEVETKKIDVIDGKEVVKETGAFNGDGMHMLKDKQGRVVRMGYFENGLLIDGQVYDYKKDGALYKTTIYEKGKVLKIIME